MPRQAGKGSRKRRQAAFERRATQHHQFIGEADTERAAEPIRKALQLAADAAGLLLAPAVIGFHLAREALRLPMTLLRALRQREA